jgi:putative PIN family toxin of toxin-antitoxin system
LVLKVVIDTNIYISAIFWNGKPREVIDLGRDGKIIIFTSVDIENEIARKLKTKFKLAEEDVNQILLDFSAFTLPVKINKQLIVVQDDPDDNKFIECALECKADYIVSGDRHLLNLKEYEGMKIINASEFLKVFYKQES